MPLNSHILTDDLVAVSLPVFNCTATLRRAVDSILRQTHRNLILVVVNDGGAAPWHVLEDIDDARLVRFDLRQNQGRYFADAVVLNAVPASFFAVQDADDWSEPTRLQMLVERLQQSQAAAAFSSLCQQRSEINGSRVVHYPRLHHPLTPIFQHRVDHFGVFRADQLREVGGYFGGFRIGYDTLLTNFLLMTGRAEYIDSPLYHRCIRADSLTMSPATGMSSPARRLANRQLSELYRRAYGHFVRHQTGRIDANELRRQLYRVRSSCVSDKAEQQLRQESKRLRSELPQFVGSAKSVSRKPVVRLSSKDDWSIPNGDLTILEKALQESQPRSILELGSGKSTLVLAKHAQRIGGRVVSLEHDPRFHAETMRILGEANLGDFAEVRLANLQPTACVDGGVYPWYDVDLDGPFDFVLTDGPPQIHGRQAALFAVAAHLARKWELWLHDARRTHEQSCLQLWRRHFQFIASESPGFVRLQGVRSATDSLERRAPELGISILTGDRLPLFRRTLTSMERHYRSLLHHAYVVVMVNGDDPWTEDYVAELDYVDRYVVNRDKVLPIGAATSLLAQTLAMNPNVRWLMHLEDDWEAMAGSPSWLADAIRTLQNDDAIGQVRLRHQSEKVLDRHMVSGRQIEWRMRNGVLVSDHAHYTFNPSLIRVDTMREVYPCFSEHEAQVRFANTNLATVQLRPGVFRHIGGDDSRRVALRR